MKFKNLMRLMFDSLFNKKAVAVLLLAMNAISVYITDVVFTKYFENKFYTSSISSMFGIEPAAVNYVSYLNLFDEDYTPEFGENLMNYISSNESVEACGRFSRQGSGNIIKDEIVTGLIVESTISEIGNLGLNNVSFDFSQNHNLAYIGYEYRNDFKVGDTFDFYIDSENAECIVVGFLKKGASWPLAGKLFGGVTNLDSYTLDSAVVVITDSYENFDNSGGLPFSPYFVVNDYGNIDDLSKDIMKKAAEGGIGIKIINEGEVIAQETETNKLTDDSSFDAGIMLFFLTLLSMSAASAVYCLMRRRQFGILSVCGVSMGELEFMIFLENLFLIFVPEVIVWIIRQRELFGSVLKSFGTDFDMLEYSSWYAHCICVPAVYIAVIVVVTFAAGVIPMMIIRKINVSEIIKTTD